MIIINEYQEKKIQQYTVLNRYVAKKAVLFTGSSLMEYFPICQFCDRTYPEMIVYNRGVSGFTTDDFIENIGAVLLDLEPNTVFINIGTNDISERSDGQSWLEHILENYKRIFNMLTSKLPETKVYIMAYYPANHRVIMQKEESSLLFSLRTKENLDIANEAVKELAGKYSVEFIDVNRGLSDEKGELKAEYTTDGVHMYPEAYNIVFDNLKPYLSRLRMIF